MNCYACRQETDQRCPRCDRPYCQEHGDELCDICLDPLGGLPSPIAFRGTLVALLLTTAFTVWLLVRPPVLPADNVSSSSLVEPFLPTPVATETVTATPTPEVRATPVPSPTATATPTATEVPAPTPTATVTATATATPVPTATPAPYFEYTVQQGDTVYNLAQRFGVSFTEIVQLNGLTDPASLSIGQILLIPRR